MSACPIPKGGQTTAAFIGNVNPIRYRGYYYDTETGLYYLQSRYYDPETCRFVNMDAYVQTGSDGLLDKNAYAYCEDDPINYSDPTGEGIQKITLPQLRKYFDDKLKNIGSGTAASSSSSSTSGTSSSGIVGGSYTSSIQYAKTGFEYIVIAAGSVTSRTVTTKGTTKRPLQFYIANVEGNMWKSSAGYEVNTFEGALSISQSVSIYDGSVTTTSIQWDTNQTMYLKLGTSWEIGNRVTNTDGSVTTTYARVNFTPFLIAAAYCFFPALAPAAVAAYS